MLKKASFRITFVIISLFMSVHMIEHVLHFFHLQEGGAKVEEIREQYVRYFPLIPWFERTDYDLHLVNHRVPPKSQEVAIIDINERTMQQLGQFPLRRRFYADFLEKVEAAGASVVAFDITFPEIENNTALESVREIRDRLVSTGAVSGGLKAWMDERVRKMDGDDIFADALAKAKIPIIMGFAFTDDTAENMHAKDIDARQKEILAKRAAIKAVQMPTGSMSGSLEGKLAVMPHFKLLERLPPQSTLGAFSAFPDLDGVIRQSVAVVEYGDGFQASLSVKAVAAHKKTEIKIESDDGLWLRDDKNFFNVPVQPNGTMYVRYYGGRDEFPYYEFSDVVEGKVGRKELEGKILFVGTAAIGLKDIRASPFAKNYPGVEVHATLASNMLTGQYMHKGSSYFYMGYLFLALVGGLLSFVVYRFHPAWAFLITFLTVAVLQLVAQDLFFDNGYVVPTLLPTVEFFVILVSGVLYRYLSEEKEKKFVREAFSRYVSSNVVEEILKDQSKLSLGGQKKVLTVMFCDMVGFTKISEHMDATLLTQLLNQFFTRMTRIILKNYGTLDKYMGDAIMCFWNAPLSIKDHEEHACRAAIEMLQELSAINKEWKEKYDVTIGIRIGINTGEMSVGNMGSDQVFSYTVLGDNVNLGSRLEGVNNEYRTRIIASEATASGIHDKFVFRELDWVRVKGKEDAVRIYELVDFRQNASLEPEWLHAFQEGKRLYLEKNWDEAEAAFRACLALKPDDGPCSVFLERIEEFRRNAPDEWTGVWKLETK